MSFWYEQPRGSALDTFAGGEASLADIHRASRDSMIYVDNTIARGAAVERYYEERIAKVRDATGVTLTNPARLATSAWPEPEELATIRPGEDRYSAAQREFDTRLLQLAQQNPARARDIMGDGMEAELDRLVQDVAGRAETLAASRDGIGKWGAMFTGGFAGAMRDPIQLYTLALGAGPGTARTIGGRVLQTAGREALINGAVEGAMQPVVQQWRAERGLDAGLDQALANVGFAALLGGAFGAGAQGLEEGGRILLKGKALDEAATTMRESLPEQGRAALDGDPAALAPIREALPPEARGALDALDADELVTASRPAPLDPEVHDANAVRAMEAAIDRTPVRFETDPDQQTRIGAHFMPDTMLADLQPTPRKGPDIIDILIAQGGLKDVDQELRNRDLGTKGKGGLRKLVNNKTGLAPDYARIRAVEAGIFDHKFADRDIGAEKVTLRDFYAEIDEAIARRRGQPVAATTEFEAQRASIEAMVADVQQEIGPGIDDAVIIRAIDIAQAENRDVTDAIWDAFGQVHAERGNPAPPALPQIADLTDAIPFFDEATGGIDDPRAVPDLHKPQAARLAEEVPDFPGDLDIPFDDELTGLADLEDMLAMQQRLIDVTEACRT